MANRYPFLHLFLTAWLSVVVTLSIQAQTACPAPTNVAASNITATSATVSFTGPASATAYSVLYTPVGGPPIAGVTVIGTSSPIVLTGLMSNTPYSVCVQTICGAGSQSMPVCPLTFTTSCTANLTWPYTENFDAVTAPALPCGITVLDANNDGKTWANYSYNNPPSANSTPNVMRYTYHNSHQADDWFFTPPLAMQAGMAYQLQFKYRSHTSAPLFAEGLEVKIGPTAAVTGQNNLLFSNTNITNTTYLTTTPGTGTGQVSSFTPTASGVYHIGFHAISAANEWYLYVDDIQVTASTITATKSNVAPGFRAEASPVPFGQQLTLSLSALQAGPLQLTLHDAVGRVVRQHHTTVPAGASMLAVPEAGTLPAGVYLLTVRQGGDTQVIRVAHE